MNTPEQRKTQAMVRDRLDTILADRYRIVQKLGEGGMGTVYLGEHTTIGKKIALKVLAPEYCHRQDLVDRFLQEARAASRIQQENVVEITDFGETPDGSVFFAMEYLKGEDLATTVRRDGPLPWSRVRGIVTQICRALAAAHATNIVHRDMKPENCFRIERASNEDFIKVLDFGIAKVLQSEEGDGEENMEVEEVGTPSRPRGLTRTGVILGTPEYMSPEQASGINIDHRADVYAVGVIMYELLTGHVPFTGKTFMSILQSHMFDSPRPPTQVCPYGDIPVDAEALILKALQKDRDFRFQTMEAMIEAIERVGTGAPPVAVVDERPTLPSAGAMQYLGTGASEALYRESPTVFDDLGRVTGEHKRRSFGWAAALALLLAGSGVGAYLALDPAEPPTAPVVVAPPAVAPIVVETPAPAPTLPEHVTLSVTTPVPAQVRDAEDGSIYGITNGEPIEIPRGEALLRLVLHADGYEDAPFEFVPSESYRIEKLLVKERVAGKKGGRKGGKGGKGEPSAGASAGTGEQTPAETTPPVPATTGGGKPTYQSPDLLNPFGKKKKHKPTG